MKKDNQKRAKLLNDLQKELLRRSIEKKEKALKEDKIIKK